MRCGNARCMSFPTAAPHVAAIDVQPNLPPEETLATARIAHGPAHAVRRTSRACWCSPTSSAPRPSNVAQKLVDGVKSRLITGVNLPMLLRSVSYRNEPLEALVSRAVVGGTQGVMQVAITAPQNQPRRNNDPGQLRRSAISWACTPAPRPS